MVALIVGDGKADALILQFDGDATEVGSYLHPVIID